MEISVSFCHQSSARQPAERDVPAGKLFSLWLGACMHQNVYVHECACVCVYVCVFPYFGEHQSTRCSQTYCSNIIEPFHFFSFLTETSEPACVCLHKRELSTVNFCFVRCLSADEKRENKRFTPLDMKMQPPHTTTICISKRHYRLLPHFFHSCSVFIFGDLWDVHVGMVLNRRY